VAAAIHFLGRAALAVVPTVVGLLLAPPLVSRLPIVRRLLAIGPA
jgi:hypothetical protein